VHTCVISWLIVSFLSASSLFWPLLLLSCSPSPDSPPSDAGAVRERVLVSGSIVEDTVWESGKEYVVSGDVTVEVGSHRALFGGQRSNVHAALL